MGKDNTWMSCMNKNNASTKNGFKSTKKQSTKGKVASMKQMNRRSQ